MMLTGRTFALLGADLLLMAHAGTRPNNAVFVLECEGTLDFALVRRTCAELTRLAPFVSARLQRPFPWGKLRWVADGSRDLLVHKRRVQADQVDAIVEEELNATIDPWQGPALRWQVLEHADEARAWFVLTWAHPLMDPRGAELLVAMLDAVGRGGEGSSWAAAQRIEPPSDCRPLREQLRVARHGLERLRQVTRAQPRSLGHDVAHPGAVRFRRRALPSGRPRPFSVTLAHVAAAVAPLYRRRGLDPETFVIPISVDRRLKGDPGPVFGNYLSFHFVDLAARQVGSVDATVAAVQRGMAEALRANAIEGLWAAMALGGYHSPGWMLRPFEGEIASFHCADLGDMRPTCRTWLGARVRGGYHVACIQPSPGLGIFFNRCAGVENVIVAWVDAVLHDEEVDGLLAHLDGALQGAAAA